MRYYSIKLTNPTTGAVIAALLPGGQSIPTADGATWSSLVPGPRGPVFNPAALQIELDVVQSVHAAPVGQSYVRIWGIPLNQISAAANLNGVGIEVRAGFSAGLPLANPAQAGTILKGSVLQAFGNWINLDQTLDLIAGPPLGTDGGIISADPNKVPLNLVLVWKAGTPLAAAIAQMFTMALPGIAQSINISPNLVLPYFEGGPFDTIEQFAYWVKQRTKPMAPVANYAGVDIFFDGTTISAFDGTAQTTPKMIAFQDLLGQPTWIDFGVMQFKCPMRGDLDIGNYVTMPSNILTTINAQSFSQFRNKSTFSGTYQITQIRHVGNFRSPQAEAWATTVDVAALPAAA